MDSLRQNDATFFNRKLGLDNLNGPYFLYRCVDKQPPTSELHGLAMQDMCLTTPKKNSNSELERVGKAMVQIHSH